MMMSAHKGEKVMDNQSTGISESRMCMWRAVIAMVHADGVVTPHEMAFVQDSIRNIDLSDSQIQIIADDLQTPQDSYEMFSRIDNPLDKKDYFSLARAVSWCDGDLDKQEELIIKNLEKLHMNDEEMKMLNQSRQAMQEVELCDNQWNFKTEEGRKTMFGFFSRFAKQSDTVSA